MKKLEAISLSLQEANEFVLNLHRHHPPVHRDKFRVGATLDGKLVGVAQVGRPISRMLDDGKTVEVVRLATDGTKNVCSFLYSRCARASKELGYKKIITYILESEKGTSLEASGWCFDGITGGGSWSCPSRPREDKSPTCKKKRYIKNLEEKDEGED